MLCEHSTLLLLHALLFTQLALGGIAHVQIKAAAVKCIACIMITVLPAQLLIFIWSAVYDVACLQLAVFIDAHKPNLHTMTCSVNSGWTITPLRRHVQTFLRTYMTTFLCIYAIECQGLWAKVNHQQPQLQCCLCQKVLSTLAMLSGPRLMG